jgi:hypothetical protein
MAGANPWVGVNFIHDNVRMEVPPAYFLQRLHDFDNMLVILPSRHVPFAYVIARRKQFSKGLTDKALESTIVQPDTKMCLLYDLVPVSLMYKTGASWNPDPVIASLAARDMWAAGGPDKVADMLEAQEEQEKERIRAATRDDLYNRSGDAWRSYQHRTGQSNVLPNATRAATTRKGRRIYSNSPSGSTAGSGT